MPSHTLPDMVKHQYLWTPISFACMDISSSKSKFGQIRHGSKVMMVSKDRAVGRSENPGVTSSSFVDIVLSDIGLIDLPISTLSPVVKYLKSCGGRFLWNRN